MQAARGEKRSDRRRLDYIKLAIRGNKFGFDKVIMMIDNTVELLGSEQQDDNDKKEYCEMQFDFTDDRQKELELAVSELDTAIDDAKE